MARSLSESILLLGAGRMGAAMLHGWLRAGIDPASISVVDPSASPAVIELARVHGFDLNPRIEALNSVNVVVIAVKPQALDSIRPVLATAVSEETLVISIVAGQRLENLAERLPVPAALVRAMPNLPAEVGRGITTVIADEGVNTLQTGLAAKLLSSMGQVEWLDDEGLLDAATALAGSGPAYVFHLVECLAEAGVAAGLPPQLADRLARVTVEGSGEMLTRSARTPSELRQDVTSPGGTTQAAMEVLLNADRLKTALREAVFAAKHRSEELSRVFGAPCPLHESKKEQPMSQPLNPKSMSVEEAQAWLEAVLVKYGTLNIDDMMSCFAPDIVVNYGTLPQIRGVTALREFLSDRYGAVTDFKLSKKVRCVTDGVVGLEATVSYTNGSGKRIQGIAFEFLTVNDEGLISVWDNISIVWDVV